MIAPDAGAANDRSRARRRGVAACCVIATFGWAVTGSTATAQRDDGSR